MRRNKTDLPDRWPNPAAFLPAQRVLRLAKPVGAAFRFSRPANIRSSCRWYRCLAPATIFPIHTVPA